MGRLTTHVLDTAHGCPAAGLRVALFRFDAGAPVELGAWLLNADGRVEQPLLEGPTMQPGRYRLVFGVGAYFASRSVMVPEPAFLDDVPLDFGIAAPEQHYHVPLLVSPWAYSTYRGS